MNDQAFHAFLRSLNQSTCTVCDGWGSFPAGTLCFRCIDDIEMALIRHEAKEYQALDSSLPDFDSTLSTLSTPMTDYPTVDVLGELAAAYYPAICRVFPTLTQQQKLDYAVECAQNTQNIVETATNPVPDESHTKWRIRIHTALMAGGIAAHTVDSLGINATTTNVPPLASSLAQYVLIAADATVAP